MALQYIVQGLSSSLTSVASQIFLLRIPFACTLKEVEISLGSPVPEGGQAVFDVNAGASAAELASIFPALPQKPKATAGQSAAVKSGLNIALPKGFLTVDADSVPLGGISAPVFLSLTIEDGLPAGVTVEGAEDVPVSVLALELIVDPADLTALGGGSVRLLTPSDLLGVANGAARLDGDSKLYVSQLPAIALVNRFVVADEAARLALAAADVQPGDFAFQVDESEVYLLIDADPSEPLSWALWLHPAIPVTLPPSGAAGGDLNGNFPNPGVDGLRGRSLGGIPSTGGLLEDDFDGGVIDSGLWSAAGQATQHDGALYLVGGGVVSSNIGNPNFTDKFVSMRLHVAAGQFVFRIQNGTLDGDTYIQIWIRAGNDIRVGKREAANSTWITGFGSDETPYVEATFAFLKVAHSTATGKVHFYRSPDGETWTELGSYVPGVAVTSVNVQFIDLTGGGANYVDTFRSDLPVADPITGKNYFGLLWDNPNSQFSILRTLGVVPLTTGAPAGAPTNVPAGHTLIMYDAAAHILYAWNGSTWDSQAF